MKFLVMWRLEIARVQSEMVRAVGRMPDHARQLASQGKLTSRYHMVGQHGGAWIYDVADNDELERLLAMSPVFNFASYDVYPLAEMESPAEILQLTDEGAGK
jgi:muconolactone delta-isomerase